MLNVALPYALPSDMFECPPMPATSDTSSSGALVPKPIITMPTISGDIPKRRAMAPAESTNTSALFASANNPPMTNTSESKTGMSVSTLNPWSPGKT